MKLAYRLINCTLLSTVSFTGCERGFDPAHYFRAQQSQRTSLHTGHPLGRATVADLELAQGFVAGRDPASLSIARGQLLQVRAWVYANQGEPFDYDLGRSVVVLPVTLKEDGSKLSDGRSAWVRALLCFSLMTDKEESYVGALKCYKPLEEGVEVFADLREEKALRLKNQWRSQQLDGYARLVGAFGADGNFYVVEYERLDIVSP